jgi:8-oxo-dGTP pyrophosphatase MutT (NUDIX family)
MDLSAVARHEATAVTGECRESAVLVSLVDGASLLFTKRAEHLSDHPGQMSFPGGRHEPTDASLWETAVREGREEVALDGDRLERVGRLDDIRTVTNFSVRPFVTRAPDRTYEPNSPEVAETAVLPVSALTDPENYDSEARDHPHHGRIRLHYFRVDGYTVWGATARMLAQFLELTTDWTVPDEADRVVDADADFPV